MDSNSLQIYLVQNQIEAEILFLETGTPTVETAAQALAVLPEQIIKSVLFLADGEPVVVIASGLMRLNYKLLADYLGMSRRRVKIAGPDEVLAITGYMVGAVPPFGYVQPIRTVLETAVSTLPYAHIYGGGGEINTLMKLTIAELRHVVGMEMAQLSVNGNQ